MTAAAAMTATVNRVEPAPTTRVFRHTPQVRAEMNRTWDRLNETWDALAAKHLSAKTRQELEQVEAGLIARYNRLNIELSQSENYGPRD